MSATIGPSIAIEGLTKDYGSGRGAFDVSFSVERGEVFGFLGPNGAGKTVTMRNLMGFIRPDSGSVRIEGLDCFAQRALHQRLDMDAMLDEMYRWCDMLKAYSYKEEYR